MINKVINEYGISIYKKSERSLAVAEASKINMTCRPDGSRGKVCYFNRINVPKDQRHKGVGTEILKLLLEECKKGNIALMCEINAYGDLSEKQLYEWYIKHGFKEYLGVLWYIKE